MEVIALIKDEEVIEKILKHLQIWDPPTGPPFDPEVKETVYDYTFFDDVPPDECEETFIGKSRWTRSDYKQEYEYNGSPTMYHSLTQEITGTNNFNKPISFRCCQVDKDDIPDGSHPPDNNDYKVLYFIPPESDPPGDPDYNYSYEPNTQKTKQ